MKIKMKSLAMGDGVRLEIGHVYDLPDEQAMSLFEGGYADVVQLAVKVAPEVEQIQHPVEFATNEEREISESPRGRRRRN